MKHNYLFLFFALLGSLTSLSAQTTYQGTVTEQAGSVPLIGVYLINKTDGAGAVTDLDGRFEIMGNPGDTLTISYTGFETQNYVLGTQTDIKFELGTSASMLDEVVVIGYGSQRSRDLTSSITSIGEEELERTPTGVVTQGLQGKVAGLQIVSAGAPGASPTVRIRGVGSFSGAGASSPLYVVDGMFFDNIDFLNTSDIKNLSVLKDASASAIYGVRAANGVVIIETKGGRYDTPAQISYNGYYGVQRAQNVVKMANAEQFTQMARESGVASEIASVDAALQRYGRSRINPDVPDVNTDWYEEILRNAPIQNHGFDVTGGSNKAAYAVGVSYFSQDGILDMKNEYERFNLRSKIDFKATDWFTIGGNVIWSNATQYQPDNSAWFRAYYAVPIMPAYDSLNTNATPVQLANAQDLGYRGGQNPLVSTLFNENQSKIRKLLGNFYAQFNLLPDDRLTFKSSYNSSYTTINGRNLDFPYFLGNDFQRENSVISKNSQTTLNQIWDNTLTFKDNFGDHNLTVLLGSSYRDEQGEGLGARGFGFPIEQESAFFISNAETIESDGDNGYREYGLSYFSRVAYNFKNKYLLYGTIRADGTRKYEDKWGYFPTVGIGWVASEESFFNIPAVNYLKFRASWGQLGNDRIAPDERGATTNIVMTSLGDQQVSGTQTSRLFTSLGWEVVEETNIGMNAELFSGKVTVEADYYTRDTKNAVIPIIQPVIGGSIRRNAGIIRNSGLELALGYRDKTSWGLGYNISANVASLSNEVRSLFGQLKLDGGSAEFRQRSIVGEPIEAFFGREVIGVYQNQAEIESDPVAMMNNLEPGDLRYKDQNGDGLIDDDDRVILGSYLPSFTWGANVGVNFKGFDLSASFFGQSGNKILNRRRGEVIFTQDTNIDADQAINAWRGEGTSNSYPSSKGRRKGWNQALSTQWIEDGDFWRIQNVQLGYTVKKGTLFGAGTPEIRIYTTADRPLTVFDYNGFTPEIAGGVDRQTYPIPATYTAGVNVRF